LEKDLTPLWCLTLNLTLQSSSNLHSNNKQLQKMRKLMIMLGLVVLGTASYAQRGSGNGGNATPEVRAERQTKMMTEKLALSEDQQKKVYTLQLARGQKMQELRESKSRDGMKAANEDFEKNLAAILTPDQVKKYEAMEAEARAQRGQGGGGQRGPR
jgi:protein CpxP